MTPVIVETPYAGNVPLHLQYLRACMRDCILRGEAPYASHGLYTQPGVLRDEFKDERDLGIEAGFAWRGLANRTVFYTNLGWSPGMLLGRKAVQYERTPYEVRELPADWLEHQAVRELNSKARTYWLVP